MTSRLELELARARSASVGVLHDVDDPGASRPPQKVGTKALAVREAWPHSPIRILLARRAA